MTGLNNPAIAVASFALDVQSIDPEGGRKSILARIGVQAPGGDFVVLVGGRGAVLFPPGRDIDPVMREGIAFEAKRLVALALREQVERGLKAKRALWRIDKKSPVFPRQSASQRVGVRP